MGDNESERGEEGRVKLNTANAEELRGLLKENERERKLLERQLSLTETGRHEADELQKAAKRIHKRQEILRNHSIAVERSGDDAKQQVIKHAEALHASVERRKESLLRELNRYQVEKKRLLVMQMEELAQSKREIVNLEKQIWSHRTMSYLENLERDLHQPIVSADQTLELEEDRLIFILETMGRLSPTSNGMILAPGTPFAEGRKSIIFQQTVKVELPLEVKRKLTFWAGCMAGMLSATTTHWLDVAKVLRQVGLQRPTTFRGYFVGLPMGAIAQGQRFGVTLLLNSVLQEHVNDKCSQFEPGTLRHRLTSFSLSVFAAGLGEALANPPVVVKNWQISQTMTAWQGVTSLWARGKVPIFFRGVVPGVVRKGLANAIVLQSIEPVKSSLESAAHDVWGFETTNTSSKAMMGFAAGSITGCVAEVLTNHPDRVKTLMQTKNATLFQAISEATRDPFRGAFWAGLRKGAIRGVNWGALGVFTSVMEEVYKSKNLSNAY